MTGRVSLPLVYHTDRTKKRNKTVNVGDIGLLKFFYVVSHVRGCMRVLTCLLNYDISWQLSALTSKRHCFIVAYNIRSSAERSALVR